MTLLHKNNLTKIMLMLAITVSMLLFANFAYAITLSPNVEGESESRYENIGGFTPGEDLKWTLSNQIEYDFTVSVPGYYYVSTAGSTGNQIIYKKTNGSPIALEADIVSGKYSLLPGEKYCIYSNYFILDDEQLIQDGEYKGCYRYRAYPSIEEVYITLDENKNLIDVEGGGFKELYAFLYQVDPSNPPQIQPENPVEPTDPTAPIVPTTGEIITLSAPSGPDTLLNRSAFFFSGEKWWYTPDISSKVSMVNGKYRYSFTVTEPGSYTIRLTDRDGGDPDNGTGIVKYGQGARAPDGTKEQFQLIAGQVYFVEFDRLDKHNKIMYKYVYELNERDGTDQNPYIIYDGASFEYKGEPTYFAVETNTQEGMLLNSQEGVYSVEYNQESKKITFTLNSNKPDEFFSGYHKVDSSTEPYVQAGVASLELGTKIENPPEYAIGTIETAQCISGSFAHDSYQRGYRQYYLNNAVKNSAGGIGKTEITNIQYVFINRFKTENEAYGMHPQIASGIALSASPVEIIYSFEGETVALEEEKANGVESIITTALNAIGDLYASLFRSMDGTTCTIDRIIFNDYEPTKIDFFGNGGSVSSALKQAVNFWFNTFLRLTFLIYVIMLLYIGIQIILTSGSDKKKRYQEYIESWVVGLIILMVIPYVIKYVFKVNDVLVGMIGKGRTTVYTMINSGRAFDDEGNVGEDNKTAVVIAELEKGISDTKNDIDDRLQELRKEDLGNLADYLAYCVPQLVASANVDSAKNIVYNYNDSVIASIRINGQDAEWTDSDKNILQDKIDEFYNYIIAHPKNGASFNSKAEVDEYCKNNIIGKDWEHQYIGDSGEIETVTVKYDKDASFEDMVNEYTTKRIEAYKEIKKLEGMEEEYAAYTSGTDLMGDIRERAGKTRRLVYSIIYIILLFQLTFLLILYYKRIFIVGILIIIFPLVMAVYVKDKSR